MYIGKEPPFSGEDTCKQCLSKPCRDLLLGPNYPGKMIFVSPREFISLPCMRHNAFEGQETTTASNEPEVLTDDLEIITGKVDVGNPRWEHKDPDKKKKTPDRAAFNDTIILMADVKNFPEGGPVTFDIYDTSVNPPQLIESVKGKNEKGIGKGEWVVSDKSGKKLEQKLSFEAVARSKASPKTEVGLQAGEKKQVGALEIENALFRFDSAVFLPSGQTDEKGTDEQEKISGIPILKTVLLYAAKNPDKKLLIAGHTDASGSEDYNFRLSLQRAQSVYCMLVNEKEIWAANSDKKHHKKDIQHILKWAHERKKWDCDPGDIDGVIGTNTKKAIRAFRKATGIGESDSFDITAWKSVFDLYQEELERIMQADEESKDAFAKRSGLQWAYKDKRAVGCGELFPKELGKEKSQINRRVEVLFFNEEDIPECACTDGACVVEKCKIYNKEEIDIVPIDNDTNEPEGDEEEAPVSEDLSRWFVPYLPVTDKNKIKTYVDGESYCLDLYDAIKNAKEEITLLGLHFSGHFHLKRPAGTNPNGYKDPETLQDLLAKKSKEGIKIYLLVNLFWDDEGDVVKDYEQARRDLDKSIWKIGNFITGMIMAAGGLSKYLKYTYNFFKYMKQKGNPDNIYVFCDMHQGYIMHTNHQKTIVIDRKVAFLGGVDLTDIDGDRFDNGAHKANNPIRNFDKPERNWHDIHMRIEKDSDKPCGVDYVYANFLGRYNYGYLYTPSMSPSAALEGVHVVDAIPEMENGDVSLAEVSPGKLLVDGRDTKNYVAPGETGYIYPDETAKHKLEYPVVQIVRSMPSGNDDNYRDNQKPDWNKNTDVVDYECSARDTYIHGIKAAKKYIYLENQWVADEKIWKALDEKAEEMKNDPNFTITVVLPKKFLESAGYGRDQDLNLDDEVKSVYQKLGDRFGVFSILQPAGQVDSNGTVHEHYKVPECVWEYMYVHSKIMIIDDVWALIGSANGGGISLTGTGFLSEPDAELSAVILDQRKDSIVTKFRKELMKEHLGVSFDTFKATHEEMHKQAKTHTYATKNEKRVHYNVLFAPHAKRENKGKWKYLDWRMIEKQIEMRANNPEAMHQTYYNVSGPLAVINMLASTNKERYKKFAKDIFFDAKSVECDIDVTDSETDLLKEKIAPEYPILEIDWMLASSMMDSENWFWDYQGSTSETTASVCSDSDMSEFMQKVVPCKGGVSNFTCAVYGEMDEAEKASRALSFNSSAATQTVVAVKATLAMFFEENTSEINKDKAKPSFDRGDPKYWISYVKDNPFLSPLQRDSIAGYPGVITPWHIKHILCDTVFIRLMAPLEYVLNSKGEIQKVRMTFWSWGKVSVLEMSKDHFAKNVNGFFVGFLTESAKNSFEKENEISSGLLPLGNGWERSYLHKDVKETNVTVSCKTGSIKVEISVCVWTSWEVHKTENLTAGKNLTDKVTQKQWGCDQDVKIRVIASADSTYSISMKS